MGMSLGIGMGLGMHAGTSAPALLPFYLVGESLTDTQLVLTFNRPPTQVGPEFDINLQGNYRNTYPVAVSIVGNVVTLSLADTPIYSDETFTLDMPLGMFEDSDANPSPAVVGGAVTNNSTVPYLPSAILNVNIANAILNGRCWIGRAGTGTLVSSDGDPIGSFTDDEGVSWAAPSDPARAIAADMGGGKWAAYHDGIDDGYACNPSITAAPDCTIVYNSAAYPGATGRVVCAQDPTNSLICHMNSNFCVYVNQQFVIDGPALALDTDPHVVMINKASGGNWRVRLDQVDTDRATFSVGPEWGSFAIAGAGTFNQTFEGPFYGMAALNFNASTSTDRDRIAAYMGSLS